MVADYSERNFVIRNEEDAFKLIDAALKKELGSEPVVLNFDNWPKISIRLTGEGYDSTITPDMASGLIELQHAMNRSYARIVHRSSNSRALTIEERDSIKFKAKVNQGSSLIEVDLGEWAGKVFTDMVERMSPEQLIISVVSLACGFRRR